MHNPNASTWAAAVSALFAGASWLVARDARKSANRSIEIEADRRHTELEPEFSMEIWGVAGTDTYKMHLDLLGPVALQDLDTVTLEIRDTKRKPVELKEGVVPPHLESQLWAKYRFSPGVDGAPANGRTISTFNLSIDESVQFQLELTPIPAGTSEEWWKQFILNRQFKVWIICEKEGYKKWKIPLQPKRRF